VHQIRPRPPQVSGCVLIAIGKGEILAAIASRSIPALLRAAG